MVRHYYQHSCGRQGPAINAASKIGREFSPDMVSRATKTHDCEVLSISSTGGLRVGLLPAIRGIRRPRCGLSPERFARPSKGFLVNR